MKNMDRLDDAFMLLFKIIEILQKSGVRTLGKKNVNLLTALTYRQQRSLFIIGDGEEKVSGGIHQKDLGKELKMTKPATSVLVENLVKKKLVSRNPCPSDRRSLCLHLTPFGKKTLDLIKSNLSILRTKLLDDIPVSDQNAFVRIVEHFQEKLNEIM
ncbi:MAG: MarR family transcriptional regulator [Planctomycetia bacterium]|nr:MarR family transcriptional regulator [Planctomycetia bacterium]